jgi:hypothetical protein
MIAATAPAESALEFAREEHTAGPFVHTPVRFYDFDDLHSTTASSTRPALARGLGHLVVY